MTIEKLMPPLAPHRPTRTTQHGEVREDPYAWLKACNWQEVMRRPDALDGEIRAYLEAENAYARAVMASTEPLQKRLVAEMKARIKEDDSTVPFDDGPFAYYVRYVDGGQHPIYCRRDRAGREEILLDGNAEVRGHTYYAIGAARHSPDHRLFAYSVDTNGSEYFTVRVRDLATGADLADAIESAKGDLVWANDSRTLFCTLLDANHRAHRAIRHRVGAADAIDVIVYDEREPSFFVELDKTESGRFIVVASYDHTTTELRLIEADAPEREPVLVAAREHDVDYDVSDHGDTFYIRTNADGAEDFKIATAPIATPGRDHWRDLVQHEAGRYIRSIHLFVDHLVRFERVDALPRISVRDLATGREHAIAFDEEAYEIGVLPGLEFQTATLRFNYSSMTTPERVFDYDMRTRRRTLRKQQEIPSGHDPSAYVTRRLYATSHDGARVPISILHRKGRPNGSPGPLVLYGYGAYGFAMPASFVANRLSLVDRGFTYAIAHVRGGTDRGFGWYCAGKLAHKPNTFRDFIAAAENLVEAGYACAGDIAIQGRSAGGMLLGAVTNMRPDLFRAVVAEVPFVDVLNTMSDAELPLTPPEWTEWGNPLNDPTVYKLIRSYSPYDNIVARDYPHVLAVAGLTDPRVTYWEPAKWIARLRTCTTGESLKLLVTNMQAGHFSAAGRFDRLNEVALTYAFLLKVFGLSEDERNGA
jgi:oligopeptidase B